MKNIEALIAGGGDINIGAIYPIECAVTIRRWQQRYSHARLPGRRNAERPAQEAGESHLEVLCR
jgi:hypothetical protein